MVEIWTFIALSVPAMIFFGMRHGLDVDHITAIDSLVRLHGTVKNSRWVGTMFSLGHMFTVLLEMILITYVIGSITSQDNLVTGGGVMGIVALATIGVVNIYSMKRWGKSSSAILAGKIIPKTDKFGSLGSSIATGMVFGLGFDTATQISALTLSAVTSATMGIQTSVILSGIFAIGMMTVDTIDSVLLRSAFARMIHTGVFRYMSYALSGIAILVASTTAYEIITSSKIIPEMTGPILAVGVISSAFAYSRMTQKTIHQKPQVN